MFVIIADSQYNKGEKLLMADRKKCHSRFWTKFIDFAMVYTDEHAANIKAGELKFNKPQVIDYGQAELMFGRVSGVNFANLV